MPNRREFSLVTQKYLARFDEILAEMIRGMTDAKLTDSISHNFIVQMIPHHRAAIEMSENILQYTTLIPLQRIAQNIVGEQTKSIADMQRALRRCSELRNTERDLRMYEQRLRQVTRTMFTGMRNAYTTNDINANFMREMIPHHEGAIRMSENALRFRICPALQPILQAIITSQRAGVQQMEALLKQIRA